MRLRYLSHELQRGPGFRENNTSIYIYKPQQAGKPLMKTPKIFSSFQNLRNEKNVKIKPGFTQAYLNSRGSKKKKKYSSM